MFVVSISGQGENFKEFVSCGHFVGFTLTKKFQPWTSIYTKIGEKLQRKTSFTWTWIGLAKTAY